MKKTLVSELAGNWYPADAVLLRQDLSRLISATPPPRLETLCAMVLPHAGYGYSGSVAMNAIARIPPDRFTRIVILGPSHYVPVANRASIPDVAAIRTPLGSVALDHAAVMRLRRSPRIAHFPEAHLREHSVQIQLPMLQFVLGQTFSLVPIVLGPLDAATALGLADDLRAVVDDRTLVLASSDLIHFGERFGYVPFQDRVHERIEALDRRILDTILARNAAGFVRMLDATGATVCGRAPVHLLLQLLPEDVRGELLGYDTSGRQTGDCSHSVSYAAVVFHGRWLLSPTPEPDRKVGVGLPDDSMDASLAATDRQALLRLARLALEWSVRTRRVPDPADLAWCPPPALESVRGGFVTLKTRDGQLRGCIGDVLPQRPIWRVVLAQSVNAALNDPRFPPVSIAELDRLRIEISVMTPLRDIVSPMEIILGRHGILLEKQGRSSLFLPQVAIEQGWDREQTLAHLSRKAGLPEDAWRHGARFQVFEADVFGEPE